MHPEEDILPSARSERRCWINRRCEEHAELKREFEHTAYIVHHRVDGREQKTQTQAEDEKGKNKQRGEKRLPMRSAQEKSEHQDHHHDADCEIHQRIARRTQDEDLPREVDLRHQGTSVGDAGRRHHANLGEQAPERRPDQDE